MAVVAELEEEIRRHARAEARQGAGAYVIVAAWMR
jgi:hypothetical protein